MKIVITQTNDDIIMGVAAALSSIENVILWNPNTKPVMDMFDELSPDVLICQQSSVTMPIKEAVSEHKKTKIVLFGVVPPADLRVDLLCAPDNIPIQQMERLYKGNIAQLGRGADLARFSNGKAQARHSSDIFFLSDIPPNINNTASYNTLARLTTHYRVKVLGPAPMPIASYVGNADLKIVCDVIKSTKIAIDYDHKHCFDYAANKVFCLSNKQGMFPTISSDCAIHDCAKYLNNDKARDNVIEANYDLVVNKHTYFHSVAEIFNKIGFENIATKSLAKLQETLSNA